MAKKKKRSSKKKSAPKKKVDVPKEPNLFLRQVAASIMVVAGIFLLIGGFGAGGSLPEGMFNIVYGVLGVAAYLTPLALFYWAYHKFTSEDYAIPLSNVFSMSLLIIATSGLLFVGFAEKNLNTNTWEDGFGGGLGSILGSAVLNALDKFPATIMFLVAVFLLTCWTFNISLMSIVNLFKRSEKIEEDTDLSELKSKHEEEHELKLNEGVPVVTDSDRDKAKRRASLKTTAEKLSPEADHEALTEAVDPNWQYPTTDLLIKKQDKADAGDYNENAEIIKDTFHNFNIEVEMENANVGPRVTQFTLKPPSGIKLNKISALDKEVALNLAAQSIRIEAPIPGKRAVGIEVPNIKPATVRVGGILDSDEWKNQKGKLSFAVGKDISGKPVMANLEKMPHLLIAGQTGSGKSVMINTLLASLLFKNSPADLKLIMVDPKQVELTPYNDIPHLLTPVITEPEKCISALKWSVSEMERRLKTFSEHKKRNIEEYNNLKDEDSMPYVVIVIDELSDLMSAAAREVETLVVRIAQKARAAGIHLVLATQRPSVDVITGLIKANVPARIAFTVPSQVDSRTILDGIGAEKLLGNGDMLFVTADNPRPRRLQGALITDAETNKLNDFMKMQRPPQYDDEVISQVVQLNGKGGVVANIDSSAHDDDMYKDAVRVVVETRKASTSLLQRKLRIGYGRAARLIEEMEEEGIIGPANGSKPREVLRASVSDAMGESPMQFDSAVRADEEAALDEI